MEKVGLQPSHHKTNTYMNPHTTLTMLEYYGHSGLIIILILYHMLELARSVIFYCYSILKLLTDVTTMMTFGSPY